LTDSILQPAWVETQGRREGRYVIGPLLGHGAMGDVYEAWDIVLARPVALKILKHLEPAAMIRFMHEAQLHARLDSPNICRIYDVDATNGTPRIAMQLIRGPTLEDAAQDLRLDEVVAILAQVAEAVHGAHQLNLIHRDLKPSNILLHWNEHGGWIPYICDFGLAMALDGPSVTQPLALTGTPAYMAPEQVRGDRSLVGPPTDVYGIGSTLYFALVGRPPCVTTTTTEMLRVKRERRFPAPRSLEPDIPPSLETVLFKCLEPSPQDRYATAAELAAALREVLVALAGPAAPAPGHAKSWIRNRRAVVALLLATLGLTATLPLLANYLGRRRSQEAEKAQIIALEGASLEQSIRNERLLPNHDLRPADARARARIESLRSRTAALGPGAEGPLGFALGRAYFLLDDLPRASAELEKAWSAGFRTPEAALLLAQIQHRNRGALVAQAAYEGQAPPPQAAQTTALAERFLQLARLQTSQPLEFTEALAASLRGNHAEAAEAARRALKANPWHLESAVLGCASLSAQARELLDAGDADGAEARYQEAMDLAQGALDRAQSDPRLHHAYCAAALGLAAMALERGDLEPASLEELAQRAAQELRLDPDNQDGQSDSLQVLVLKAMLQRGQGRDPRKVLDQALQFFWGRTREPRSLDLRMDHMVLYWLQAEAEFDRGEDPGPSLTEALKDTGHTSVRIRDLQGEVLNFKARIEASRGQDPRPTVEAVVARFEPPALQQGNAGLCLTAAKAWLIRAEWELGHGIDGGDSLRRAQTLTARALERDPTSASAHALQGLSQALEARSRPDQRATLLARAGEHLRWAERLNPQDPELARLRVILTPAKRNGART